MILSLNEKLRENILLYEGGEPSPPFSRDETNGFDTKWQRRRLACVPKVEVEREKGPCSDILNVILLSQAGCRGRPAASIDHDSGVAKLHTWMRQCFSTKQFENKY